MGYKASQRPKHRKQHRVKRGASRPIEDVIPRVQNRTEIPSTGGHPHTVDGHLLARHLCPTQTDHFTCTVPSPQSALRAIAWVASMSNSSYILRLGNMSCSSFVTASELSARDRVHAAYASFRCPIMISSTPYTCCRIADTP